MHSEKQIEQYLTREVQKLGGVAFKFTSPGRNGVPDRLCLFPNGRHLFVEVKSARGRLSALQLRNKLLIQGLGHPFALVYGKDQVDETLKTFIEEN